MHEPSGRTIIVGDVHGCRDELDALLDRVAFASGDRLVFVGDVVARGPDSLGVLDVVRRTGAILVRGNHEQKLLDWKFRAPPGPALAKATTPNTPRGKDLAHRPPHAPPPIGKLHRDLADALRPVDWTLLATSPVRVDLESHGVTVVHAGVLPGIPLDHQRPEVLLRIRTVRADATVSPRPSRGTSKRPAAGSSHPRKLTADFDDRMPSRAAHVLWGTCWQGPPHVVFGHNAAPGLQLHPWATGLDTGCVYGGKLTALVLGKGQKVPRSPAARRALLVSEPARKIWWQPEGFVPRLDASAPAT